MNPVPADMLAEFRGILSSFGHLVRNEPEPEAKTDPLLLLDTEIMQCGRCPDEGSGRYAAPLSGHTDTEILILNLEGGNPDRDPYSGEAGEMLRRMFFAIKLPPERLYTTHLVKCHRPGTAPAESAGNCLPFLKREIALTAPRAVCCLDLVSASLIGAAIPPEFEGMPVFILPSPLRLLTHPEEKRQAWEVLKQIRTYLDGIGNAGS